MSSIPETSTTLLRDISASTENARWGEFCERYEPMMRAFLQSRFADVEADDVIQDTLVSLAKVLPRYRYNPGENGHFHNYLTGILRNKALNARQRSRRHDALVARVRDESAPPDASDHERDYRAWRDALYEIALQQYLADDTVQERTKRIFVRRIINGESIETIGQALGVTPNTVSLAVNRAQKALQNLIARLKSV